ncbi:DNA polymerase III subunit chi [Erythrobacter sp. F6033]|uniref:DNA polymerase III subunit chi n=1 Tax=Erythrobacter sp. F6033 TaxID=2926401 RepID=UPI001FF46BF6|nr:DNA polymerase III subunit chi [Erythrobacter sp. F6033]MCK0127847.1 DNA polymerase III subunit chi [Erythrobacter sp. F6033]
MKIDFWQLSRDPADTVCTLIAQRVLDSGERLLVVSKDAAQREAISKALWKRGSTAFLANGEAGSDGDDRQPILLSDKTEAANSASHIIYADGEYREAEGFARTFLLFDDASLEAARATWRSLDGIDGLERSFFRQDGGKWVKVA